MDPTSIILPILKLLIQKATGDNASNVSNNIRRSMEGQALIEFDITDERQVYVSLTEFKKQFGLSCFTVSRDTDSIVLAFPGEIDDHHIVFFNKRGINSKEAP